ncbi:MAG: heavy metal-associated domain-containing protein [Terrimicrobiaceae bacterium]|nr:heavy-metal-associated domain-containing protein [Terrimicrobiaceae bacterium]
MKRIWTSLALVALASTTLLASGPSPGAPQIVTSSEIPALIVRNVQIDSDERALSPLTGVRGVRADLIASKVTVFHNGTLARSIAEKINKSGVTVVGGQDRHDYRGQAPGV